MMENTTSSLTEVGLFAAICSDNPSKVDSGNIKHDIILCQGYFSGGDDGTAHEQSNRPKNTYVLSHWPMYGYIASVCGPQYATWIKITAQGHNFNTLVFGSDC